MTEVNKSNPLGLKVSADIKKGKVVTKEDTKDIYKASRPEGWAKNVERDVHQHQAKFAASLLNSVEEDIAKAFKADPKLESISLKGQMAYKGNNVKINVKRSSTIRNVSTGETSDKPCATRMNVEGSFKSITKDAKDSMSAVGKKLKLKPVK